MQEPKQNKRQISAVWFVNQTKYYESVSNGEVYTIEEIFNMAVYKCMGKEYRYKDLDVKIPLLRDNGDMNILKIKYDNFSEFNKNISLLPLLREVADDYSRTYIKFRYDQDNSLTINIVRGSNKYYINLDESQFDEFCSRNNLRIRRDAFNTYF